VKLLPLSKGLLKILNIEGTEVRDIPHKMSTNEKEALALNEALIHHAINTIRTFPCRFNYATILLKPHFICKL
jgi:hypothetical protein